MYLTKSRKYVKRKVLSPLLALLTMGITPQKLALTIALGAVIGIMPFFGLATLFCTLLGLRFRLNVPAMLLVCYLVGPLHFLLYIPFIKAGIWVFGADAFRMSFDEILTLFQKDWVAALEKIWVANMLGLVVWLFLTIPLTAGVYYLVLPLLRKYIRKAAVVEIE